MPEGDTIHSAARRVGAVLVGSEIVSIETPQPLHRMDRWPDRLAGRAVRSVDARGKHLFVRFEGDLTLHSHLRMGGMWGVYRTGERWRRAARRAWLVIRAEGHQVVQFDGPVLELMTDSRTRFDQRLAALGPDVLASDWDEGAYLRRLREDDQTRIDPWRRVSEVSNPEALEIVGVARPLMELSVERGGRITTWEPERPLRSSRERRTWVYGRGGLPCRRCQTLVRSRGQGDDNRTTFWCPRCQR